MTGSIRFAGEYPPAVVFGVALFTAAVVAWYYLRETKTLDSAYAYLLPALRGAAVALVILILAGPVWHRRQIIGTLGRVIFAIDTSQSMSITDSGQAGSSPERLRRASELLTGHASHEGWLESLNETHDVQVLAFSSGEPSLVWSSRSEEPIPTALELVADGEATDLASAMSPLLSTISRGTELPLQADDQTGLQRAAFVMFSDGRDNGGRSAVDFAKQLEFGGAVVHAVGMGSEDEPPDVGIVNVVRPDSVAADGKLSGQIVLKLFGASGQPLNVRIESAGQTVWQKTITPNGDGQQSVPFEFAVETIVEQIRGAEGPRGVQRSTEILDLRAAVQPVTDDYSDENNALPFRVAASIRDRRLLILDGSSRWETRYLRNLFDRDPAWEVDTILFGPGTDMPKLVRGEDPGEFPDSRESLSRYDAIILGQIPGQQLGESDTFLLREFVTRGGGLIVIDGRFATLKTLAGGQLADLFPIEYLPGNQIVPIKNLRPTGLGLEHPVMNLIGDTGQLVEFWTSLPAPRFSARVSVREGAEVWADVVTEDNSQTPWLVTRLFGGGRVFYFAADESWRWRYKVADRFHARFWNQILAAVMQPPYSASDEFLALGTDKIEYLAGESSTIRVRLQDASGKPVGDATVDALLIADDRIVSTVPLAIDDPARGTYQGQTPGLPDGAYSVRVRASGFDQTALQASTPIWVGQRVSDELQRVSLNRDVLLQISEAGGGKYVHESAANELLEQIRPLSSGTVVESDILIWQSYYWFWAVIALLAIEWWLRKRAGLV